MSNYLPPTNFFNLYPSLERKGKLYGGICTSPQLMRGRQNVLNNMSKCRRHWTYENENCDSYIQIRVWIAPR